jgi:hypothetical protein
MFDFLKKHKPATLGGSTRALITQAVRAFLESRGVSNFKVYTLEYGGNPVVLVKAEPQKKLRFSNILEAQIRKFLKEKYEVEVPAVFWRFKMDYDDKPGPEQVDYEFEEQPRYAQDEAPAAASDRPSKTDTATEQEHAENELYDLRSPTEKGIEVEEVSMLEFDDFLKDAEGPAPTTSDKP